MNHYLPPTKVYQQAKKRYEELYSLYGRLEKKIALYPDGKIHIVRDGTFLKFYIRANSKEKSGHYLSKTEHKKIKIYLQKKYEIKVLNLINKELKNLSKFLQNSSYDTIYVSSILRNVFSDNFSEIKSYLNPVDISDQDYINEWLAQPYERKKISDKAPEFITDRGEHVRSKSELNIANMLNKMNIPYKYEYPFLLSNGNVVHPDFTVLNIHRRVEVFWEHRGMMDDRTYANDTVKKIKDYEKNNIFLGDRLIISEETSSVPLGTKEIEVIIKHYFVDD